MGMISTAIRGRPAREHMMELLVAEWRPFRAIIEDRLTIDAERATGPLTTEGKWIGFESNSHGMERGWQMATVKWIAVRIGQTRFFSNYSLPIRRAPEFPSFGKVPFWVVNDSKPVPLLVDHLWSHSLMTEDLPPRLHPYVVDQYGLATKTGHILGGYTTDASLNLCMREELVRLDDLLGSQTSLPL